MIGRYEAYMDGTALSSIDNSILITDLRPGQPEIQIRTDRIAGRDGGIVYNRYTGSSSLTIALMIREQNVLKRQDICQRIAQWANAGTYLTTNDRRWQRMKCICEKPPVLRSALNWTEEIQMVFKAYNPPYWESLDQVTVTLTGTSASGILYVPGNVKGVLVGATITAGASVDTLSLTMNGKTFSFSDLGLSSGDVVTIDYDDDMKLRIKKGTTSLMDKRTAASADDLTADCGKNNACSITASGSVTVTFRARGWWL